MTASLIKASNLLNKVLVGIVLLLFILVLWLGYQIYHSRSGSEKIIDPGSLIVRQVRDVSELTTAMFEMDAVVPVSEKGMIAQSKLLYIAHGNVRVGVDLKEFQTDNVQVEGEKITVTLPPLKILDSKLNLEHSSVYSYDRGLLGWGPDVVNLQAQAQREALKKVEDAACQSWLIKTASDRVQKTVENLLNQVLKDRGFKQIIVEAQLPSEGSCSKAQV
ncbi:DUF4230 domain-containing protein [Planktothrix sp. FACHB-1355]|uniref:DUF4230 domain-containing protein n=1 Tax=Aerosakkonema funiforme FACHB-1375 TaxID=2949571 RepID=A0A926VJS1_9CYAN|nr:MULTISPECIES: DUF4230 domain-containing protein [Oscillatoriales]MBD2184077.1 DUF4230 domain-containing protein [Aerosakkonema funiforme FACHB-1375]MBD3558634.1 DUF4230 domain-containing protein [Planktothrix sp. FACHB-1355]